MNIGFIGLGALTAPGLAGEGDKGIRANDIMDKRSWANKLAVHYSSTATKR